MPILVLFHVTLLCRGRHGPALTDYSQSLIHGAIPNHSHGRTTIEAEVDCSFSVSSFRVVDNGWASVPFLYRDFNNMDANRPIFGQR